MKIFILSSIILLLSACASTPPADLITQTPANDIRIQEVLASPERFNQSPVRWGGRIVKTEEKGEGETAQLRVEINSYPLDQNGSPVQSAQADGGRFIAILQKPYKKSRFYRNRWVTVAGVITGTERYPLANGADQLLPVLSTQAQYAWREERRDDYYYDDYWWPRFYFRYGIHRGSSRGGIGIFFPH